MGSEGVIVGLDLETTGLSPRSDKVSLVQTSHEVPGGGVVNSVIDALRVSPTPLLEALNDGGAELPAHNAKFEWQHVKGTFGVELEGLRDTMLMEQVLDAGERHHSYKLIDAVSRHLPGVNLDKTKQGSDWSKRPLEPDQIAYAAEDARVVRELYLVLKGKLREEGLEEIADLENRVVPFTAAAEMTRMDFDKEAWARLEEKARKEQEELEREMRAMLREASIRRPSEWSLNSPKDIATLLEACGITDFEGTSKKVLSKLAQREDAHPIVGHVLEYKAAKSAKDEAAALEAEEAVAEIAEELELEKEPWNFNSHVQVREIAQRFGLELEDTNAKTLSWYAKDYPFFRLLILYKKKGKLVSTYGSSWYADGYEDGAIWTSINQNEADSGRESSSTPNMQNVPKKGGYRECFVAPEGMALVTADYSQIELRVLANVTGDPRLLWAFRNGEDVHKVAAMGMTGKKLEDITIEERQRAKVINFGLAYGITAYGLPDAAMSFYGLPMSFQEAERYIKAYFKAHPKVKAFQDRIERRLKKAEREGRGIDCYTPLGRRRKNVTNKRAAFNHPIQGAAADGLKQTMARLYEARHEQPNAQPWIPVHDSISYVCPVEEAEGVKAWLVEKMVATMDEVVNATGHRVPIAVEAYVSDRWLSDED